MANQIQHFCLLQLVFLAIVFSNISVCGDRGPYADEDDAQPLVPSNGKGGHGTDQGENKRGGSFGLWNKWTECAYNVNNQCMDGPGEEQKVIRSYRILAYCAGGENCTGAKLLYCYPSRLDPSAFPDESSKEPDITPGRRATSQIGVINDPDNNITKACAMLLEECREDPACLGTLPEMAKKEGEPWHGFLIARVQNGFDIHLPFGKNGKIFHFVDWKNGAESPHLYLNFGTKDRPMRTFVSDGNMRFVLFTSHNARDKFFLGSNQGIRFENALGLWMLGLDILPDEEHQVLRLYTAGFPVVRKWTYCDQNQQENDGGLVIVSRNETAYIDSWFLKPYTPDMAIPRRPIHQTGKTIELVNNNYTQPINTSSQGFTRFFVHAKVNDGTKSMGIKIVIGSLEDFKLTLFQFEYNKENGICTIFFQQNMLKNCTKFKFDGVRKSFWIFVDMDKGVVALNCQREYQFNGPLIFPIVDEAKFEITGEGFELFEITQDHKAVSELKSAEYVNQPIFVNLPFRLDKMNILAKDTIYLKFTSHMFDASKFIHFKLIANNSNTNKNELLNEVVFKTKCPAKSEPTANDDGNKSPSKRMVACVSLKCDGTCAGEFNLLMQFDLNEKRTKLYLNGIEPKIEAVNWDQISQTPPSNFANPTEPTDTATTPAAVRSKKSYSVYYAQIYGDLVMPVQMDIFKKTTNMDIKFGNNAEKLSQFRYIIIHGMVFNEKGKFSKNQPYKIFDVTNVLTLNFDLNSGIIEAIVPNINDKTHNVTEKTLKNAFNLKMAKPFWIKIAMEREGGSRQHHFYYRTYLNDREKRVSNIFTDLKTQGKKDDTYAENIMFTDHNKSRNAVLLDNIVALPFALKIDKAEENAADGFTITTTFRLLENCKIVQMFLASIPSRSDENINSILGIDDVVTMENRIQSNSLNVYAHFLARFDQRSGMYKFCFGQELLFESGSGNQKNCDANGMVSLVYDHNKEGKIVSAKIVVAKDGTIQVEFNGSQVAELKPNDSSKNAAQSTHFVISGDITLVDGPKK